VVGHLFDDHSEQDVVGVGVVPGGTGGVVRPVGERDVQQVRPAELTEFQLAVRLGRGDLCLQVIGVVVQAAGVLQQFADGDRAAVVAVAAYHAGQPVPDGVIQRQPVLRDQLQHRDRE